MYYDSPKGGFDDVLQAIVCMNVKINNHTLLSLLQLLLWMYTFCIQLYTYSLLKIFNHNYAYLINVLYNYVV